METDGGRNVEETEKTVDSSHIEPSASELAASAVVPLAPTPVPASPTCPSVLQLKDLDNAEEGAAGGTEEDEEEVDEDGKLTERIVIQKHEQRLIVKTPEGECEKVIVSRFSKSREASPALSRRGRRLRSSHSAGAIGSGSGSGGDGGGKDALVGHTLSLPPDHSASVEEDIHRQYSSSQEL